MACRCADDRQPTSDETAANATSPRRGAARTAGPASHSPLDGKAPVSAVDPWCPPSRAATQARATITATATAVPPAAADQVGRPGRTPRTVVGPAGRQPGHRRGRRGGQEDGQPGRHVQRRARDGQRVQRHPAQVTDDGGIHQAVGGFGGYRPERGSASAAIRRSSSRSDRIRLMSLALTTPRSALPGGPDAEADQVGGVSCLQARQAGAEARSRPVRSKLAATVRTPWPMATLAAVRTVSMITSLRRRTAAGKTFGARPSARDVRDLRPVPARLHSDSLVGMFRQEMPVCSSAPRYGWTSASAPPRPG